MVAIATEERYMVPREPEIWGFGLDKGYFPDKVELNQENKENKEAHCRQKDQVCV